ncbi:hypothetical protein [Allokutzneria albata]|uniref:DUF4878 domain-containing protein n=1 Tax=Allokutzneria albata TaxID=211114 RepID=A0A1G9YHD7_ALLAB|nr:hypothetical protein [Allokutzneria albata]SDN08440.1 hypothetical protein SAMN04489726_4824 [Allokutzneria albata]
MLRMLRSLRAWILVVAVAWIATITVLIMSKPEDGAPSADVLATQIADALRAQDADRLAQLVSLDEGGDEVARVTVANFGTVDTQLITSHLERLNGVQVVVDYVRPNGERGALRLPAVVSAGRWKVTPVATP